MLSRIVFSFIVSKWTCFLVNIIHDMYVSVLQVPLFSFLFFSFGNIPQLCSWIERRRREEGYRYPVAGINCLGSSQILHVDSDVVGYCVPQVEQIVRSSELDILRIQVVGVVRWYLGLGVVCTFGASVEGAGEAVHVPWLKFIAFG